MSYYDDDFYGAELDYREKEWDEPGPEFGHIVRYSRSTGEVVAIFRPDE